MKIRQFFDEHINGYLLNDLETMHNLKSTKHGNCSYPMLQTILSGMELVGTLTADPVSNKFDPNDLSQGSNNFVNFWTKYFVKKFPAYNKVHDILRQNGRNGISHIFLVKKGIIITRNTGLNPTIDIKNQQLTIDVDKLFNDFKVVLNKEIEPLLNINNGKPSCQSMQIQLDEIEKNYLLGSKNFSLYNLKLPQTNICISQARALGASTSPLEGSRLIKIS